MATRLSFGMHACVFGLLFLLGSTWTTGGAQAEEPPNRNSRGGVTAQALLRIARERPYLATKPPAETLEEYRFYCRTQAELMRSTLVLNKVVTDKEIARAIATEGDPRQWVRERLELECLGDSELWAVRFHGPTWELSEAICNAVVEKYFAVQSQEEAVADVRTLELAEKQLKQCEQRVTELTAKLHEADATADRDQIFFWKQELTVQVDLRQQLLSRRSQLECERYGGMRVFFLSAASESSYKSPPEEKVE